LSRANLSEANLSDANLRWANLSSANLSRANLSRADLSGADLDYSCWPLWCGSLSVKVDERILSQLAYHLASLLPEDDVRRKAIKDSANAFHRVISGECKAIK
jgi:hypothetical protein